MNQTNLTTISHTAYTSYKEIPVEFRTPDIHSLIEEYETANNIVEKDTTIETAQLTVVDALPQPPQEQREIEANLFDPSTFKSDPDMVEYHDNADTFMDSQLPPFKDERIKKLLVYSAAASIGAKYSRHKLLVKVDDTEFGKHLADKFGSLNFAHISPTTTISKAIKEALLQCPYMTIAAIYLDPHRDTKLDKGRETQIKFGNQFTVHLSTPKYVHNDTYIVMLEDTFEDEIIPKDLKLDIFSSPVQRIRYLLSKVRDKKVTEPLIAKLKTIRPPQVKEEKYNEWVGILAMALLTNLNHFNQIWELMIEVTGTEPLEKKYELAVALELVIPKYEAMLKSCKVTEDQIIPTTLVKILLKGVEYNEIALSDTFADLGFPLKEYKAGIPLTELKTAYEMLTQHGDKRIQSYRERLSK
ncbi:hypothetical protein [Acinetobacter vivianii]|uniref:hypothetical protein n=1 Tax=Acinetobacter vivianii TaxID=1776742 RepID=UPI004041255E